MPSLLRRPVKCVSCHVGCATLRARVPSLVQSALSHLSWATIMPRVILRVADLWFRGLWRLEVRTSRVPGSCRVLCVRTVKTRRRHAGDAAGNQVADL